MIYDAKSAWQAPTTTTNGHTYESNATKYAKQRE